MTPDELDAVHHAIGYAAHQLRAHARADGYALTRLELRIGSDFLAELGPYVASLARLDRVIGLPTTLALELPTRPDLALELTGYSMRAAYAAHLGFAACAILRPPPPLPLIWAEE